MEAQGRMTVRQMVDALREEDSEPGLARLAVPAEKLGHLRAYYGLWGQEEPAPEESANAASADRRLAAAESNKM